MNSSRSRIVSLRRAFDQFFRRDYRFVFWENEYDQETPKSTSWANQEIDITLNTSEYCVVMLAAQLDQ